MAVKCCEERRVESVEALDQTEPEANKYAVCAKCGKTREK